MDFGTYELDSVIMTHGPNPDQFPKQDKTETITLRYSDNIQ